MGTAFELDLQEGLVVCLVKGWWQELHNSVEGKSRGKGWEGETSTFFCMFWKVGIRMPHGGVWNYVGRNGES